MNRKEANIRKANDRKSFSFNKRKKEKKCFFFSIASYSFRDIRLTFVSSVDCGFSYNSNSFEVIHFVMIFRIYLIVRLQERYVQM